jgi:hypothetical protein
MVELDKRYEQSQMSLEDTRDVAYLVDVDRKDELSNARRLPYHILRTKQLETEIEMTQSKLNDAKPLVQKILSYMISQEEDHAERESTSKNMYNLTDNLMKCVQDTLELQKELERNVVHVTSFNLKDYKLNLEAERRSVSPAKGTLNRH